MDLLLESQKSGKKKREKNNVETAYRYCEILRLVPRWPRKTDTRSIKNQLESNQSVSVSLRTIQRDLINLSAFFQLTSDNSKPYGWSWSEDVDVLDIPHMDPVMALSFTMVKEFLSPLMPPAVLRRIESHFKQARNILNQKNLAWPDKIGILSRSQPLKPPHIDNVVFDTVYDCLLHGKRFSADYKRRGESDHVSYTINPLGIVLLDTVIYLVCTIRNYNQLKDVKQLSLHRIVSAEKTDEDGIVPEGFNLKSYIDSGAFHYVKNNKTIRLHVLFDKGVALHLQETPLSEDQIITDVDTETVMVQATVLDTAQLRWWLLGFGEKVEVLEPVSLRDEFREKVEKMMGRYSKRL